MPGGYQPRLAGKPAGYLYHQPLNFRDGRRDIGPMTALIDPLSDAYLRSLPPVAQPARPHDLRFPFNTQAALAIWRTLYFKPGEFQPDTTQSAAWNRGAYLVQGLGHCNACHAQRNALGATAGPLDLGGGLIPVQNWYAPSLTDAHEAGVADIIALLKTGVVERHGALQGTSDPMADVVLRSTQYLSDVDLTAMATYLRTLGQATAAALEPPAPVASKAKAWPAPTRHWLATVP